MANIDMARRRSMLALGPVLLAGCALHEDARMASGAENRARGTDSPHGNAIPPTTAPDTVSPQLKAHLDRSNGPKRILSLDGGGLRGVFTLEFLDVIEAELRRRTGNDALLLRDYFDLIGGTSTGSIIAAALACGMSVAQLKDLYRQLGPSVFNFRQGQGLLTPKFDANLVREALDVKVRGKLMRCLDESRTRGSHGPTLFIDEISIAS